MPIVYEGKNWKIERFISGFANNAYLITSQQTRNSVIIDTPDQPRDLIAAARLTTVQAILITHNHWDHLEGFDDVLGAFRVPVGIGVNDAAAIEGKPFPGRIDVSDGTIVKVCDFEFKSFETPGHTPGSTSYLLAAPAGETSHVFTGDTLFPGGPGRSASPEALEQILESITTRLHTLADETMALPGHGDFITIGASKEEYRQFAARERPPGLFGDVAWAGE